MLNGPALFGSRALARSPRTRPVSFRTYATSSNLNPTRPQARVKAELPNVPNRKPVFILAALIALGSWSAFASFATNKERLSSSVFKSALVQLKDSAEVQRALGDPIMLVPSTFGDPWVSGSVNMMQGRVDMSFRLQGPKDKGTAYFTSIRRDQSKSFEVIRFLVVTDSGETVPLLSPSGASHDSDGEIESNVASP
ncbi:uncharacterized protein PFL1_00557 [Pseudozyma flocculosa PF-1]|uniref:uncharacterized protein n=1 Tax=Pseudozyma flocculosa PF-1 TaxID=1277687 RepID=UPI00045600E2|nr:uncharacterized protein PFL1_00557 [Pseudozyma flocculosa PF-1]EPQ32361.1 hypothetical protein PFL1_00557 [Pseudozyma flocculosa PF-1]